MGVCLSGFACIYANKVLSLFDPGTSCATVRRANHFTIATCNALLAKKLYVKKSLQYIVTVVCVCVCVQEGLVDFYRSGSERRNGNSWPSIGTLCGCAFGALLTLGALFVHR